MTTRDLMVMFKAYVKGDARAGQVLGDAFEEAGDAEGAELLRSGQFSMSYDDPAHRDLKGTVRFERGVAGPMVFCSGVCDGERPVAEVIINIDSERAAIVRCYDDSIRPEAAASVTYSDEGAARVGVNSFLLTEIDGEGGPPAFEYLDENED
jgi:hypothetical protein